MPGIKDFVRGRIAPMADGFVKAAVTRAMNKYEELEREASAVARDENRSPIGKRKGLEDLVRKNAHEVVRIRKATESAKARLAERIAKLQPPSADKTDAFAAATCIKVCELFHAMSRGQRKVTLSTASLSYTQALLAAPVELSGLDPELREMAVTRAIDLAHPGKLAEIERVREDIQMLDVAARVLADMARDVAQLPNNRALDELISSAVTDTRHIDADIEHQTASLAA